MNATRFASAGEVGAPCGSCGRAVAYTARSPAGSRRSTCRGTVVVTRPVTVYATASGSPAVCSSPQTRPPEIDAKYERRSARITVSAPTCGVDRAAHRPATDAAVRRVVHRDRGQDVAQQPALDLLEPRLRRGEQPDAVALGQHRPPVVPQRLGGGALEPVQVGEPGELALVEVEQAGQCAEVGQQRDRPGPARHRGRDAASTRRCAAGDARPTRSPTPDWSAGTPPARAVGPRGGSRYAAST